MATVRFSGELKQRIRYKAGKMFDDRIEAARENPPNWAGNIYDLAFGENVAKMNELPEGYFRVATNISIRGFDGVDWDDNINEGLSMNFPNNEERRFPNRISNHEDCGLINSSYSWLLDADDPRWDAIKAEYKIYCEAIYKLIKERNDFVQGVDKVIDTYSTLGPALKAWPALWDLIPEDVKDRHREIVKRSPSVRAVKIAEEVDLNKLTGHIVADKLVR